MAITFLGSDLAATQNTSGLNRSFSNLKDRSNATPTLQQNDLIIAACARGHATSSAVPAISGYTTAFSPIPNGNDTNDVSGQIFYKFMPATPDSQIVLPAPGTNGFSQGYAIFAFRGVDTVTPLDGVAPVTASGINGANANPPAITPNSAGAFIFVMGGGSGSASATNTDYVKPSGLATGSNVWQAGNVNTTTQFVYIGAGFKDDWSSGSFDCPAFSSTNNSTANAWVAGAIVLRPAPVVAGATGNMMMMFE